MRYLESEKIFELAGDIKGKSCLDIGSGAGFYANLMLNNGASNVTCVDRNSLMLAQFSHPHIEKVVGDAENFKTTKNHDFVLLAGVIEFLEQPIKAFKNAHRHCNDGGKLVALVPSKALLANAYNYFHRSHGILITQFSKQEISAMLETTGWHIDRIEHCFPFSLTIKGSRRG